MTLKRLVVIVSKWTIMGVGLLSFIQRMKYPSVVYPMVIKSTDRVSVSTQMNRHVIQLLDDVLGGMRI